MARPSHAQSQPPLYGHRVAHQQITFYSGPFCLRCVLWYVVCLLQLVFLAKSWCDLLSLPRSFKTVASLSCHTRCPPLGFWGILLRHDADRRLLRLARLALPGRTPLCRRLGCHMDLRGAQVGTSTADVSLSFKP